MHRSALPVLVVATLWASASLNAAGQAAPPTQPIRPASPQQPGLRPPGAPPQAPIRPVAPPPPAPVPTGPNDVIGKVNDTGITWNQFFDRLQKDNPHVLQQLVMPSIGPKIGDALFGAHPMASYTINRQDALDTLRTSAASASALYMPLQNVLVNEAIDQEAAKQGVQIGDAQVNAKITQILLDLHKRGVIPPGMTDDQFLTSKGVTRSVLVPGIRRQLEAVALERKDLEKQIGHPLGPDDFYQASHILIKTTPPAQAAKPDIAKKTDDEALAKLTKIEADIRAGKKTFELAAKESSGDPSGQSGGGLGVAIRTEMVKPFEEAVYTLKPGQISKPVKSPFGYHLIRLDKAGKDIPAADREKALEGYLESPPRLSNYVQVLTSQKYKLVNNLPNPQAAGAFGRAPQ